MQSRFSRILKLWVVGYAGMLTGVIGAAGAERVYELAGVEVLSGWEPGFGVAGAGYRIDGQVLEAQQTDDINRLLARVPGVYLREEDGFGLLPHISLRGVDVSRSAKVTLLEDGLPAAPAPYSAPAAYYAPSAGRMSGLEVVKGTSQVRYGPHTTGGVVNYLSTPLPGRRAGQLHVKGGSAGEWNVHGWAGDRLVGAGGVLDVLGEGYYRRNDGFQHVDAAGVYAGTDRTGFERAEGLAKFGWSSASGRHRLEGRSGTTSLRAYLSYLGLSDGDFRENPYRRYAGSRGDVLDTRQRRASLGYGLRLGDRWDLAVWNYWGTFHRNWYKLDSITDLDTDGDGIVQGRQGGAPVALNLSAALAGAADGRGLEALKGHRAAEFRLRANNRSYHLAGTEWTLRGHLESGGWEHNPVLGIRHHADRERRLQWHDRHAQQADGSWLAPVRSPLGSDGNQRQRTAATAVFAEHEMVRGAWMLRPGVRYEHLALAYEDFTTDGTGRPAGSGRGAMGVWAAGLAGARALGGGRAAFANVYRGFSVPGPRAAIRQGVREETSLGMEAGMRLRNGDSSLTADLVLFHTRFSNLIVIDNIGAGSGGGPGGQPLTENVGRVNSSGLELLLGGDLAHGAAGDWRAPATLAFTWTVAQLQGDSLSTNAESIFAGGRGGSRVPYVPEFAVTAGLGWEAGRWSTGVTASWRSATRSTAAAGPDSVNPVSGQPDARYGRIDPVFLLDWNGHYRLGDGVRLFATVTNLLDRAHLVSRHAHGPRPGAPRMVTVGVALTY